MTVKPRTKRAVFAADTESGPGIPPASTKAIVAQRGANVAILSRIFTDLSAEEKVAVVTKIFPSGKASIAAGVPPAALLVGANPEPPLNYRHTQTKVRR